MPALYGAGVPEVFNYQGRLLDEEGRALGGAREAVFGVYDVPAGGTAVWEQHTTVHADTNGLFNVTLGGGTNSLAAAVGNKFGGLYLDMAFKIGGVMEPVRPRPQFVSAAYAQLAENIAGAMTLEVTSNLTVRQKAQLGVLNVNHAYSTQIKAERMTVPTVQDVAILSPSTGRVVRVESPAVFHGFTPKGQGIVPSSEDPVPYKYAMEGTWYQATSDRWLSFSGVAQGPGRAFFVKVSPTLPDKPPHYITSDPKLKSYSASMPNSDYGGLCVPIPAGWWFGYYGQVSGIGVYYYLGDIFENIDMRWIPGP